MIYRKTPGHAGRSGGLTQRDTEAKPPKQIPKDVLQRLEQSLRAEKQAADVLSEKKK